MKSIFAILTCLAVVLGPARAQTTQPIVAIHDSELTRAFLTQAASNGTPTGAGTTGKQWWPTDWNYFVMPEALQEMFRSDGTAFTVLGDSNITAGLLLSNGVPRYPIFISLAAEAIRDDEIAPLTNYVAAGGFLFIGSSSFTRNTNGTSRGNFAIAGAMGVNMVNNSLANWGLANYLTTQANNRIVNDIPAGQNIWRMPTSSEEISWGTDPNHPAPPSAQLPHDVWQVQAAGATVLAVGDNYPYILMKQYGKGWIIYDAAFQPLIGHGGFAPGMYAYMIFRRSVEWAFEAANLPVPKLSAWPYQYDSAYMVRHDLENYPNEVADLLQSAQIEYTNGAKGDYYFCTGTLRSDMSSNYNTNAVVNSLRTAVGTYGATIGPHNGGLRNQNNISGLSETNGVGSSYDYWHWGQDEVLDLGAITNNGITYSNGYSYALASTSNSFLNIESWLSGLESSSMRLWCTPYFNGTRENSYIIQSQLNVKISGDQKLGPFPHWTVSTQTSGKRYAFLSQPVSDWYVGGLVAQSLEPWHPPGVHTSATMHAAVDFYYNLGALVNIYSHTLATGEGDAGALMPDYLTYCANTNLHPRLWSANGVSIYQWWLQRSNVVVNVSYATNGNQSVATFSISGSTQTNTTVELLIPSTTSFCNLQVLTNGALAGTNAYRVNGQLVKVLVGTSVTNAVIEYYPMSAGVQVFAQNFDSVTAPALPSGWTSSVSGAGSAWTTVKTVNDTAPNSVFVPDAIFTNLSDLISPSIALPSGLEQLTFRNNYNLEAGSGGDGFDGGVLEIKIGSGAFTDILAAGGSFVTGGYTSVIDTNYQNPLAGRTAWSGSTGGFVTTTVNLPAAASGTNVQFRWRCGTDNGNAAPGTAGWWIDTITITNRACLCCGSNNTPPSLPSQSDLSIGEFSGLVVTNTATDPNLPLFYTLTSPPSGAAIDSNGIITWTPQQNQSPGTYSITTVVMDSGSPPMNATNSFNVTVNEVNVAPAFGTVNPQTVNELVPLTVTNAATETNSHSVTTGYGLVSPPSGATINANGVIHWTPQQNQSPGSYTLTIVVTNSNPYDTNNPSLTATNSFNVTVKEVNVAPTLSVIGPQTVNELVPLTVTNAATESNIHSVTTGYNLVSPPSGAMIDTNGVIHWMPQQNQSPGSYTIKTVVTNSNPYDTNNPSLKATNSFTVAVKEVNVAPTLGVIGPQTVNELVPLTVTNAATETNSHSVTTGYGLVSPPSGATIDTNGVIHWTPQQNQSPGSYTLTTVVTNSNPYDTNNPSLKATNAFAVTVKEVNVAPTLAVIGPQTVNELVPLTVTNTAAETNIHSVTTGYGLVSPPAGATIDTNGVIHWTPQQNQSPGSYAIKTVVTNSNPFDTNNPSLIATNSFNVTVNEVNVAPTLGAVGPQTVNELVPLIVTNTATEPNIHSLTTGYGLVSAPSGATIDTNGVIHWTPQQNQSPGSYAIKTLVTNSSPYDTNNPSLTATNSFNVTVNEVNVAPALGAIGPQTVNELVPLTVTNAATESNVHSVTTGYGLVSPPSGATIDTNGVIHWTPQQNQSPGSYAIKTVVTNNNPYDSVNPILTATNSFNVTVNEVNVTPALGAIGPQTVNELVPLIVTNTATEPNIHSVTTGYGLVNPPSGATIDTNGVITWTPQQNQSPGSYTLTTVVTNSNPYDLVNANLTATNSFNVTVNEVNVAPILADIGDQSAIPLVPFAITNAATEPNIHSVTTGYGLVNPPAGASIDTNGVITWTPNPNQGLSTNVLTTVVTNFNPYDPVNPSLTATNNFNVIVGRANTAPVLPTQDNVSIDEHVLLVVTNAATDADIPANTLTYQLVSPPSGAAIDTNGVITWTPGESAESNANVIITVVTDDGVPPLSATNSFNVTVTDPVTDPTILSIKLTNSVATITWTSVPGHSYTLQYRDSAGDGWTDVMPPVNASGSTASTTNAVGNAPQRFYQVVTSSEHRH